MWDAGTFMGTYVRTSGTYVLEPRAVSGMNEMFAVIARTGDTWGSHGVRTRREYPPAPPMKHVTSNALTVECYQ